MSPSAVCKSRCISLKIRGLTPKRLARVIRFRHALAQAQRSRTVDWAQLALECGYFDQAHFINEFRELAGTTPAEYAATHLTAPAAFVVAAD